MARRLRVVIDITDDDDKTTSYQLLMRPDSPGIIWLHKLTVGGRPAKSVTYELRPKDTAIHGYLCNCKGAGFNDGDCRHAAAVLSIARLFRALPWGKGP